MKTTSIVFIASLLLLEACSSEAWKRSTYGAINERGRTDCQRSMERDCGQSDSYDSYRRKRDEAVK